MLLKILKVAFQYLGILAIIVIFLYLCYSIYTIFTLDKGVKIGIKFMENLNDEDLLYWANDALELHSVDSLKSKGIGAIRKVKDEIDDRYSEHGIIRIDVNEHSVNYVWMGGFDHTSLHFEISNDSIESVTAVYNNYARQQFYPELEEIKFDKNYSKKNRLAGNKILSGQLNLMK